jgi:hypothetical protein
MAEQPAAPGYSQAQMDELLRLMRKREADAQDAAAAAAKGAAGGGALGGLPGALVGAGLSIATPFVTKALGGLFGVSDAEEEERQALERAKAPFRAVAQGGTTQGQAGIAYARGRTLQDLASQTKRVSAQQLADTQAQYSAQLSDLRSREQERARAMLGSIEQLEAERAAKSAQRQRQALSQGIAGAVVPLAQQLLTPKTAAEVEADRQKESAAMGFSGQQPAASMSSGELASALGFLPGAAAAAAPAVAAGVASAVSGAAGAPSAGGAGSNEIESMLAQQDQTLASLDPSVRAAIGPSAADVQQSGLAAAGLDTTPAYVRRGLAPVTASERQMQADTLAGLQAQRQSGMGLGPVPTGPYGSRVGTKTGMDAETRDIQASIDINKSMSPFMKTSLGGEQVAPAPLTGDFQPTITDELRKQRPGRMPRRPRPVRGGGGLAL